MILTQIGIATLGAAAVWLSQDQRTERRKWSSVCGLLAAPFWLFDTWQAGQFGMFALSLVYGAAWASGFRAHWLTRPA